MRKLNQLEWLLNYERRLAERYRYFCSLVMMAPTSDKAKVIKMLENTMRSCDEIFAINGDYLILMPHTTNQEACVAVNRYRSMYNREFDIRYSVTSFPGDVYGSSDPIRVGIQRLDIAKQGGYSEVISNDY